MINTTISRETHINRPIIPLLTAIIICCLFSIGATIVLYLQIRSELIAEGTQILDQIEAIEQLYDDKIKDQEQLAPIIYGMLKAPDVTKIITRRNGHEKIFISPAKDSKSNVDLSLSGWLFSHEKTSITLQRFIDLPTTLKQAELLVELKPIHAGRYLIYLALCSVFFILLFSLTIVHIVLRARKQNEMAHLAKSVYKHIPPLSVLVADDNEISRKIISAYLKNLGHKPILVNDGEQVLRELEKTKIDLLIIDLYMPGLNGAETVEVIRQQSDFYRHIPIIGLSADNSPISRQKSLSAGMDEYLVKPVNQTDLENILNRWLTGSATTKQQSKIHDLHSLRSMLLAELPDYQLILEKAYKSGDHQHLYQTAHKIAGGSVYCEIPILEEAALALQSVAHCGNKDTIASQTKQLIQAIESTLAKYI